MRFLLFLLLVSCAPLSEQERFDRDYEYAETLNAYIENQKACYAKGGIWITQFHQRKNHKPSIWELRTGACAGDIR